MYLDQHLSKCTYTMLGWWMTLLAESVMLLHASTWLPYMHLDRLQL